MVDFNRFRDQVLMVYRSASIGTGHWRGSQQRPAFPLAYHSRGQVAVARSLEMYLPTVSLASLGPLAEIRIVRSICEE